MKPCYRSILHKRLLASHPVGESREVRHALAEAGHVNPKFVQELLGHADISLTLNVYSHVLPDLSDAAAGARDDALG